MHMPKQKVKVVFMGTPDFAVRPLQALIEDENIEVLTVVTQEDKKIGRKQVLTPPPVKRLALEHNIPVLQPPKLKNNKEAIELLEGLNADLFIVVAYGHILPPEVLRIPRYGSINIHGSLLPKYRGASPIEEALQSGDTETGLTFIQMENRLDAGPVLHVERIEIAPEDTALTLREKMSIRAAQILPAVLRDILEEVAIPIPQDESHATYCHKISKKDGLIDVTTMTAEEIKNRIRAYTPWPSCFLSLGDKRLKLLEVSVDPKSPKARPGEIVELENGRIGIGTKKGIIIPLQVQLEGKKPMTIQEFLRGNRELFKELLTSPK